MAQEEKNTPSQKHVYLMRGLPCSGKSHRAKRLAGSHGVVLETDEYFYTQVGEDPKVYDYDPELMSVARRWNFERFKEAVKVGTSPIVVDRGNSYNIETHEYAKFAVDHGYTVELAEPDSEWWQEIRILLKYKKHTLPVLYQWAEILAKKSHETPPYHAVGVGFIRHLIDHWRNDITIEKILAFDPSQDKKQKNG